MLPIRYPTGADRLGSQGFRWVAGGWRPRRPLPGHPPPFGGARSAGVEKTAPPACLGFLKILEEEMGTQSAPPWGTALAGKVQRGDRLYRARDPESGDRAEDLSNILLAILDEFLEKNPGIGSKDVRRGVTRFNGKLPKAFRMIDEVRKRRGGGEIGSESGEFDG